MTAGGDAAGGTGARAPVAGLLLAAGRGRRMGRPKSLLDLHGTPAVSRALQVLADGGCAPLAVVLGAAADEAADHVAEHTAATGVPVDVVVNEGWADGMGGSLRAGLDHLASTAEGLQGVVVHLVDQPLVGADVVTALRTAAAGSWAVGDGRRAWAATWAGRRRTPVLLDAAILDEVRASAAGDRGARDWLDANPQLVQLVDCDRLGAPDDLDTPADLAAYLARP